MLFFKCNVMIDIFSFVSVLIKMNSFQFYRKKLKRNRKRNLQIECCINVHKTGLRATCPLYINNHCTINCYLRLGKYCFICCRTGSITNAILKAPVFKNRK